jgi:transcriptional regulator with XRE-family HTH domain
MSQETDENILFETIAERVKQARKASGFTQSQLSEYSGVGRATIARIESGKHGVNGPTLHALATAMRTSVGYLLGRIEESASSAPLEQGLLMMRLSRQKIAMDWMLLEQCAMVHQLLDYFKAQGWEGGDDSMFMPKMPTAAEIQKHRFPGKDGPDPLVAMLDKFLHKGISKK